ncbi:phosphoribosylglycinamide formyltransferase [uncultured Desulfobacter sp.]|uniref:phosphoribosylglycinamide formyltransferase n=1 Tax=uncultured Desulfobacter sp. TaxID=240139 RepID=UPI002AAA9CE0|nr:phosphoribosylglycinamide formyltransferase [uncultured Desulfobacter sp.]
MAGKLAGKLKVGTLISGGGTNLQAIIDACNQGRIDARIVFTGSDVGGVKGLERAKKAGIDTFVVDYARIIADCRKARDLDSLLPKDFDAEDIFGKQRLVDVEKEHEKALFFIKSRVIAERELLDHIESYDMDLLVLAGFMRVFTPYFIDRINTGEKGCRIMNIHPALLPAFPGTDGYGDTFRYGCKIGGCTVHFIDYGEDTGPIIGQKAFEIGDNDTLEDVKRNGLEKEWELYPACIQKFAQSRRPS